MLGNTEVPPESGLTIEELERRIAELTEQLNAKRRTAVAPKPPTTRYKRSLERCG